MVAQDEESGAGGGLFDGAQACEMKIGSFESPYGCLRSFWNVGFVRRLHSVHPGKLDGRWSRHLDYRVRRLYHFLDGFS